MSQAFRRKVNRLKRTHQNTEIKANYCTGISFPEHKNNFTDNHKNGRPKDGHLSATLSAIMPGVSGVDVHDNPPLNLTLQDISAQLRQIRQGRRFNHGLQLLHRQIGRQTLPGPDAVFIGLHHGIDTQ